MERSENIRESLKEERHRLVKEALDYMEQVYPNEDDIVPDDFIHNYCYQHASIELKKDYDYWKAMKRKALENNEILLID